MCEREREGERGGWECTERRRYNILTDRFLGEEHEKRTLVVLCGELQRTERGIERGERE